MKNYEINRNTLMILPINNEKSIIIEKEKEFEINLAVKKIIDNSCKFFGSSYQGRVDGTKSMINIYHKAPIVIEESSCIIFFPTVSPRLDECCWVSLNHISNYYKIDDNNILIKFYCGKQKKLNINYSIFDNQVLRAARLQIVLEKKKDDIIKNL